MILIEGPDNSGKSTLALQLSKEFGFKLYDRPHGPPKNADELVMRALQLALVQSKKNLIVDRHPLIGENVYGPILRGHNMWDEKPDYEKILGDDLVDKIHKGDVFIIYCRPPREVVLNLKTHQVKDYDTPSHLKALTKKSGEILDCYDENLRTFASHIYDYTEEDSLKNLIKKIRKDYLNERK